MVSSAPVSRPQLPILVPAQGVDCTALVQHCRVRQPTCRLRRQSFQGGPVRLHCLYSTAGACMLAVRKTTLMPFCRIKGVRRRGTRRGARCCEVQSTAGMPVSAMGTGVCLYNLPLLALASLVHSRGPACLGAAHASQVLQQSWLVRLGALGAALPVAVPTPSKYAACLRDCHGVPVPARHMRNSPAVHIMLCDGLGSDCDQGRAAEAAGTLKRQS